MPELFAFNTTIMFSTNTGVGLETLIPIDIRRYQIITDSSTDLFRAARSAPNVEVFTTVWRFDGHVVGVDSTTEKNPVGIQKNTNVQFIK